MASNVVKLMKAAGTRCLVHDEKFCKLHCTKLFVVVDLSLGF